jgi:hypothetical protein
VENTGYRLLPCQFSDSQVISRVDYLRASGGVVFDGTLPFWILDCRFSIAGETKGCFASAKEPVSSLLPVLPSAFGENC